MKTNPNTPSDCPDAFSVSWLRHAGLERALLAQVDEKLALRRRAQRRAGAATITAVGLVLFAALWLVPYVRQTHSFNTPFALRQALVLEDGSHVELNARTSLQTDFRYHRRVAHLDQGEAFFSVTKDPTHPFYVITPAGTVRVLGTKFNVRSLGDQTEVTLLEGSVAIERPDRAPTKIVPGQRAEFSRGSMATSSLEPTALSASVSWLKGQIVLDGLSLAEAAERLSAFHGVRIDVDPAVCRLSPGGIYPLDDLKAFLSAVETVLPVHVVDRGNRRFSIVSR